MGHRKQRTSFVSVVSHHLIRYDHLIRYHARDDTKQPASSSLPASRRTHALTPPAHPPKADRHHRPSPTAPQSRASSFVPSPSPFPLSKSGARRYDKQATPTPDDANRRHLRLISSDRLRTDRQGSKQSHGQPEQARDTAHRRRPRRQASKTRHPTRHHASPLPVANGRKGENGTRRTTSPAPTATTSTGKQATTPAAASPPRRDTRDEKRTNSRPAATRRASRMR